MSSTVSLLKNKYFLYITSFFSGMSVMAIELGASRLLAPYFSSSQIVWTVIIGTIMIATATGNVIGGRIVDKNPNPDKLYIRLLIAAIWTACIPLVGKYVIGIISFLLIMFVKHNFLIWASLVSCFVLFVFPLILLGTVTPSLVKFSVDSLNDNGKTVGELGAINTIGSILGTFLPTFVTIPAVGTSTTFLIFASILALISLLYFVSAKRHLIKSGVSCLIIVSLIFIPFNYSFAFWEKDLAYEGESIYNYLQVKEDDYSVALSTNVLIGIQSIKMKERELTGMYYDYALAAPMMLPEKPSDILILGLGTGTYAELCLKYFEDISVEGVEIDEKIVALAKDYFDLSDKVDISVDDGRAYLQNNNEKLYDVIMVDAYQDITIPFQMSTVEFFTLVKEHLSEDGVMVVNMNMYSDENGSINNYLSDTISQVFDNTYIVSVDNGSNQELFASDNASMLSCLDKNIDSLGKDHSLNYIMKKVRAELVPLEKGDLILTDDKAPVELLGMKVIDELISDNIDYYKKMLLSGDFKL